MPTRPNILFIVLDTLRRDRLSIYGHARETSPEFDAFAAQATLFERAVAPAQWTIPSHASMFTGLPASTHGVTEASSQLSGLYPTLAEILQVAGYKTAAFCNNPLLGTLNHGLQRGFSEFYNYAGAATNRPRDMHRSRARRAAEAQFRRAAMRVQNEFANNDWLFRMALNPLFTPLWTRWANFKGSTEFTIDDVIAYWSTHAGAAVGGQKQQPLFAFVNLMGSHLPYRPPQGYLDRFAPETRKDRRAEAFMRRFNTDSARWASPPDEPFADWEQRTLYDYYDAEIAYQDAHLGRLLRYLRASGALENTLVIICSDHGEGHGDHQFFGHGFVVYQELVHVPLAIHYPALFPLETRIRTNISTRRLFHTVLQAAQLKPPLDEADPNADVAGLSLVSAAGAVDGEQGIAFAEAFPPQTFLNVLKHRSPALIDTLKLRQVRRGVYAGDHKLAVVGAHPEALFDIAADPLEVRDIAPAHLPLVTHLQTRLNEFVLASEGRRADAPLTTDIDDSVADNLRALGYID